MNVLLLSAFVAGTCLPTRCLAMGIHVTILSGHSPKGTEECNGQMVLVLLYWPRLELSTSPIQVRICGGESRRVPKS
jgi:hypothetical protein